MDPPYKRIWFSLTVAVAWAALAVGKGPDELSIKKINGSILN
jgi:hypothetical protein